jgi:arabinan endo-1,5-alpha-L-arabinosidase
MIDVRRAAGTAVVLLALVLAGCGGGTPVTGSSTRSPTTTSTTPTSTSVRTPTAPPTGSAPDLPRGDVSPIHDPALIVSRGVWYVFSTGYVGREQGGTIRIASSHDQGRTWTAAGSVWDRIPAWIDRHYADRGATLPDNLWAPEIVEHDGTFYLYYSASTFGSNDSITALATSTTLDPDDPGYRWVDRGAVLSSPVDRLAGQRNLQLNAIDAGVVSDAAGKPYLTVGSFWNGIFLVPISWPSGKPRAGWAATAVHLAERPDVEFDPIEAAYVVRHGGYFYLFTSWNFCCRGADSTYQIAVGRASSVTGPYRDQDGRALLEGGGTVLLGTEGKRIGAGGQSVFGDTLAYHFYDGGNAAAPYVPTLGLRAITWTDGWPRVS